MAGRSVDVSLRIKAQDEASKALDTVGKALRDLAGAQKSLSGGSSSVAQFVENLGRNVDSLSVVFKKLDTSLAGANRAYEANARQIATVNASIDARKKRIEELARSEAELQRIQGNYKNISPSRQASFVGPVPPRLSGVQRQLGTETGALAKEEAALQRLITRTAEARTAALEIRNVQGQVATALDSTTNAFVKQANALDQLAAAEKRAATESRERQRNSAVRDTVNQNTGVGQTGTPGSLRGVRQRDLEQTFAPVFRAEDNQLAAEAKKSADAFAELQRYARDVAESLDPVARVTRMVAEEQERLAAAVRGGALSQTQADAALNKYRSSLDGTAAATDRQGREFQELSAYVQELRRDFDRAGYAEQFLTRETEKLNRAVKAGVLNQNEYGRALETVRRKAEQLGEQSNPQLFGLNPYQTQNLLFQFNDIATQLASGTSITQTLAQQGGQILQLFPRAGNAIVGAFTAARLAIVPVVAVIAAFVLGINEAFNAAERLRTVNATLGANADGANFDAAGVVEAAKQMRDFGVAVDEAMKIARVAIKAGFDQSEITNFGEAAKGLSIILGNDVPAAAQTLADALTGGFDALVALDKQTNIFTASELDRIRTLIESGDATAATAEATSILNQRLAETAANAEGPWERAMNKLGGAWDRAKESLANSTVILTVSGWIEDLADGITGLIDLFDQLSAAADFSQNRARSVNAGNNGNFVAGGNSALTQLQQAAGVGNPAANREAQTRATEIQKKADQAVDAKIRQVRAEKGVTTEQEKQVKLAEDLKRIRLEVQQENPLASASKQEELAQQRLSLLADKYNGQLKQIADTRTRSAEAARREAEQLAKQQNTLQFQAAALLRNVEGFRSKAYYDVNAFRAGFGSDTVTRSDGRVERVTSGTTVSRADAERDLARRIEEFANVVKQQIGSERFGQFSAQQQAALVSIAYNYGELPNRIVNAVKTGTAEEIGTAVRGLRNDNSGINAGRREREARILELPNVAVEQGSQQAEEDAQERLDKYNETLDQKLSRERRSIENQKALVGLQGEALRVEIERQQIAEETERATEDLRRSTDNPTAELSGQQREQIAVNVRARLKLDEPARVFADLQKQLDDIQAFRGALDQKLQTAQQTGDTAGVTRLQQQIEETDRRIAQAAANLEAFLTTPGNAESLGLFGQELDNILFKLTELQNVTAQWQLTLGSATITAQQFANTFTNSATGALDQFAQAVAGGANAFGSLLNAFRQFAADFLLQIARMIQQQIIFNLISSVLSSIGGAPAAAGSGLVSTQGQNLPAILRGGILQAHGGGVVGMPSTYGAGTGNFRTVSPAMFATATRYHSGGIAGLKPGEVPAVLMRGEEVLTRDDPRHMMNGGGGGGAVKIVNAFDEGDVISKAMETKAGERAVLNLVRRNPRAFQTAMNGG